MRILIFSVINLKTNEESSSYSLNHISWLTLKIQKWMTERGFFYLCLKHCRWKCIRGNKFQIEYSDLGWVWVQSFKRKAMIWPFLKNWVRIIIFPLMKCSVSFHSNRININIPIKNLDVILFYQWWPPSAVMIIVIFDVKRSNRNYQRFTILII